MHSICEVISSKQRPGPLHKKQHSGRQPVHILSFLSSLVSPLVFHMQSKVRWRAFSVAKVGGRIDGNIAENSDVKTLDPILAISKG